jgi:hypothetical protein
MPEQAQLCRRASVLRFIYLVKPGSGATAPLEPADKELSHTSRKRSNRQTSDVTSYRIQCIRK